ncbi:MAG: sterol desaturase family protein [Chitinophagaceae bacterium]
MLERIVHYFQTLEQHPLQRMAFLVGGLLFFWMIESAIPLLQLTYKKNKLQHALVNFTFTIFHLIIHTFLAILIVLLSDWCKSNNFGIVYWLQLGTVATIVACFLVLDFFGGWLVHIVEHKVPFLWRFHVIHHSDNAVDVSSGLRHHPVESVVRGCFFFMGILVSGAPMYAVMIFQTLLIIATAFTHANMKLPAKLDNLLSYLLVSPNMHKVHHHWKRPYTDSNYGAVLAIWDRLFGTVTKLDPSQIKYGLDNYYPNEKDEDIWLLLRNPFQKKKRED